MPFQAESLHKSPTVERAGPLPSESRISGGYGRLRRHDTAKFFPHSWSRTLPSLIFFAGDIGPAQIFFGHKTGLRQMSSKHFICTINATIRQLVLPTRRVDYAILDLCPTAPPAACGVSQLGSASGQTLVVWVEAVPAAAKSQARVFWLEGPEPKHRLTSSIPSSWMVPNTRN
jgi:hypothetical protein